LREESVVDYPDWATRELLMNAICHRDYTSHGPIQFYQFDDRIEIMNHGGLYGRANEENFPNVNEKPSKKPSQKGTKKGTRKGTKIKVPVFPSKIVEDVFEALKINPKARLSWLADNLGVSERTIKRAVNDLKELGYINSEHSKVKGVWQLLK
jgi:predicted HTH transcriptional regulator